MTPAVFGEDRGEDVGGCYLPLNGPRSGARKGARP